MKRKEAYVGEKCLEELNKKNPLSRSSSPFVREESIWKAIHFDRQACRVGRYELDDRSGDTHYYIVYKHPK